MLKPKLKECKSCGKPRVIWKEGMCQSCCTPSFRGLGKKVGFKPRKSFKKAKKKKSEYTDFFRELANKYLDNPISFESGKNLGEVGNVNLAHIFPKDTYKSLAQDPRNIILLAWEEHTRFDELLGRHDFDKLETEFKSWSKICEIVKDLLPLCEEEGKLKTALIKYLDERI